MKRKLLLNSALLLLLLLCSASGWFLFQNWDSYQTLLAEQFPSALTTAVSPPLTNTATPTAVPQTNTLPQPDPITPHWQTHSHSEQIQAIAPTGNLIWLGTTGGLVALDPATGQTAHFFPEHGLPANQITAVKIAPDTAVWVATGDGGVGRYDGHLWTRYTMAHGLPSDNVRDLALTASGEVWAATSHGLAHLLPTPDAEWTSYTTANTLLKLPSDDLTALTAVAGGLWIGSQNGLFFRDHSDNWHNFSVADGLPSNEITALTVGSDGLLWVATPAGLARYDQHSWRTFTQADGLLHDAIVALGVDEAGGVWLGFGEGARGAQRLTELDGHLVLQLFQTAEGLPDERVTAMGKTVNGQVWLGTAHGVAQYQLETDVWQPFQTAAPTQLPSNQFTDLQASGDTLWVASQLGLSQKEGETWRHSPQVPSLAAGLPDTDIRALSLDPTGTLWAAHRTLTQGVSRYDELRGEWVTRPCIRAESSPNIYASAVQSLLITSETGAGWLGAHDGLFRLEPTGEGLRCLYQPALAQQSIKRVLLDPSATTKSNALLATATTVWQATPSQLTPWPPLPPLTDGRPMPPLRQIAAGADGSLWAAGDSFVAQYLGQDEWHVIPLDGFFRGEVRDIAHGRDRTLYVATNKGLLRYNQQWHTLTTATGLASNDVHHLQIMPDGTLWIATAAGLSSFHPGGRE